MSLQIRADIEEWPIRGAFTIARGTKTVATVVVVTVDDGRHQGRGECVPYPRYGETPAGVVAAIGSIARTVTDKEQLAHQLPPGAARSGLDCALWDLEAKRSGVPVAQRCGRYPMHPVATAYTIGLGSPKAMADAARAEAWRQLLKVKLGGPEDMACLQAVRSAAPQSNLIVDANEGWQPDQISTYFRTCADCGVGLIEQPLPENEDGILADTPRPVPVCADESVHVASDLDKIAGKYDAVNVKLDKAGGLSEALSLADQATDRGFSVMVGCMVGTSLAMAPALLLAQTADIVDLDGPLLLLRDREPGLVYTDAMVEPPSPSLWG